MGIRSYLLSAVFYWGPLVIVASWFKGAPWWTPFPILAVIVALAALIRAVSFLCARHGGELGRKLTEPL